jgi:predicted Zn-ribbon and HTH transcriptional regulator
LPLLAECTGCHHVAVVPPAWVETWVQCPKCDRELFLEPPAPDEPPLVPAQCLECGHETEVPEDLAATWVRCPECSAELFLEPAEQEEPERVLADCDECGHRAAVPVELIGTWVQCPKCLSEIVLEPAAPDAEPIEEPPAPPPPPPRVAPPRKAVAPRPPPAAPVSNAKPARVTREVVAKPPPARRPAPTPLPTPRDADDDEPRGWLDAISPVAVILSGAGLTCSAVAALCFLVVPLCGTAILVAVGAAVRSQRSRQSLYLPLGASALTVLVFLTAVLSPETLGKTYRAYRDRGPNLSAVRAVPLPRVGEGGVPPDPDWADASRFALLHAALRVQVTGVTVEPVELRDPSGRPTLTKDKYLVVRVQTYRTKTGDEFAAGARGDKAIGVDRPKFVLTDNTGKVYAEPALDLEATRPHDPGGAAGFPLTVFETVAVFEPPAPGVEFLRLEIPTTAWGGTRPLRFTIPKTMIRTESNRDGR